MPSIWHITLRGHTDPQIPLTAVHAVLSRWLDDDHKAAVKPYALDWPRSSGDRTTLGVRLLNDRLHERLRRRAQPGTPVRIGGHTFTVDARPSRQQWCAWPHLYQAAPTDAWQVNFTSPTTFRRGSRSTPWPSPESLVTSLVPRWRELDPATAEPLTCLLEPGGTAGLWVADLAGRSRVVRLPNKVASGFVGQIRYMHDGPVAAGQAFDALLRFAEFAGVGSHTAYGLGTVELHSSATAHAAARAGGGRGATQPGTAAAMGPDRKQRVGASAVIA